MVRSHTQELLSAPRLRNACDRCHSQKLRCLKPPQGGACLRCAKFGSTCVHSARTTRRSSQKESTDSSSNRTPRTVASPSVESIIAAPTSSDATLLAESCLDPSSLLHLPDCDILGAGGLSNASFFPNRPQSRETGNASPQNALIPTSPRDLATFHIILVDHCASFSAMLQVSPISTFGSKVIAIDQTFALTRRFLDIFKQFSVHSADQATILLFLSCYHRLMDVYQSLFKKMQLCTQSPHAVIPAGTRLNMPVTQLVSYVASDLWKTVEAVEAPMTAYGTHFMLLLLLCTGLCEELRDAIASGRTQDGGGNTSWDHNSTVLVQDTFYSGVRTIDWCADKDQLDESVRNAMWKRWIELATQIQLTKQAAMMFAVACL